MNAPFVKAGNECIQNQLLSYNEDLIDRTGCDCRADCGGTHFFASETRNSYTDKSLADIDKYISLQVTFLISNNMIFFSNFVLCVCTMTDFVYYYPKIMSSLFLWNLYEVHEKLLSQLAFIVLLNDPNMHTE